MVRFFADGEELRADTVVLTGENAQHAKVLRLKAGETVLVCDGQGTECLCEVTDAGEMKLNVLKRRESTSEAAVRVSVYMAFPKADKLECPDPMKKASKRSWNAGRKSRHPRRNSPGGGGFPRCWCWTASTPR